MANQRVEIVTDVGSLAKWIKRLEGVDRIAFDTETDGLDSHRAHWVGISFACEGAACYVPLGHQGLGVVQCQMTEAIALLRPLFENKSQHWVAHHSKFDLTILERYGLHIAGQVDDTLLISHLVSGSGQRHGLDVLAMSHLQHKMIAYAEVTEGGKLTFDQV